MRTTLDIDDALLAQVQALYPAGTAKTVLLEEGLRRLLAAAPANPGARRRDPRMQRLIDEGRVTPARILGPPPAGPGGIPLDQLLADLAGDREDR